MAVDIPTGGAVAPQPDVCTQLRVVLPGGMLIQGSTPNLGASPLEVARATISAANGALAPLGPFFSMLDAVMALIDFAKTVPKVLTNPKAVVDAVIDVLKKASALASLVPQLSVPIMVLGIIDVIIAYLGGIQTEVSKLSAFQQRIAQVASMVGDVPSLAPIVASAEAQMGARRAQISCSMGDVQPLLTVVSQLMKFIGLPPIEFSGDAGAGSIEDLASLLETLVNTLTQIRSTIPI
jgi:hypothetical protein